MSAHPAQQLHYPALEAVLGAVASWIVRYRQAHQAQAELRECDPDEVARVAREMNVSPRELSNLVARGPDGAALLGKMLKVLGIDPEGPALKDLALTRDLQRVCVACDDKRRCQHEFARGTAGEHYREFCPNAYTLKDLMGRRH